MKSHTIVSNIFGNLKQRTSPGMTTMPSHSSSQALKSKGETVKQRDRPWRSDSKEKEPFVTADTFSNCRMSEYGSDYQSNTSEHSSLQSKGYPIEYLSPTESLSSSLSSFPIDHLSSVADQNSTSSRKEKNRILDKNTVGSTMKEKNKPDVLSSENGAMVEVSKITLLVEEELKSQRDKHKEQINRLKAKFKDREEKYENEINLLRAERDEARRELEKCKQNYDREVKAIEQSQQQDQTESLEQQKRLVQELQRERDSLLNEVSRTRKQQKLTKEELSALKVRVRIDSEKRLKVMECLSTSWDAEMKQAKQKETLLTTELDIMTNTLKAEQQLLKTKNKECAKLEAQYQLAKTELRSIKMKRIDEKDDMNEEMRLERDALKRLVEEQKQILKLKTDETYMAETTIRSLKAELKSARENFSLKEQSMARSIEATKMSMEKNGMGDPEVEHLREENNRLNAEIRELQKQVESYLANMALQHEFCESLKSRIYKEQENEHEQVGEINKLRKHVKKQQNEVIDKDLQIEKLKELLDNCSGSEVTSQSKILKAGKKNGKRKKKTSSKKSGYRTS